MEYKIIGTTVPAVELKLNRGESVYCQKGGMAWMSDTMQMQTNTQGGLFNGVARMISGESFFMNTYTAQEDNATIAFATTVPGSIVGLNVEQGTYYAQKGSFLAAEQGVQLGATFTRRIAAGLFGGEGIILQSLTGRGTCFLEIDGDAVVRQLKPNEKLIVNTGNVLAFQESVTYNVEMVKGLGNMLFGGEGLFITTLTGPGKVIIQTMNLSEFRQAVVGTTSASSSRGNGRNNGGLRINID